MSKIKGITVTLHERVKTGTDAFKAPVYRDNPVLVENVLVSPVSSNEILDTYNLTGRKAVYQLAIPKGDAHDWSAGTKVSFFGSDWRIIAIPLEGIEELIPLDWNRKVQVEKYE